MTTTLIACDKFKGSLTAAEVCAAVEAGIRSASPETEVISIPIADGGDGTAAAAVSAGYEEVTATVTGPSGQPVTASFALDRPGGTAVVEMARASGLLRLTDGVPNPLGATSFGTGELVQAALDAGARTIILAVGGSASTDGGAGFLQALGAALTRSDGSALGQGGGALGDLAAVNLDTLDPRLAGCELILASDVDNPLLGSQGAAAVYAPQKGANESEVRLLEQGLQHYVEMLRAAGLPPGAENLPGAGAAGGVGFAAQCVLGATTRAGVDVVMDITGYRAALSGLTDGDLVITGEGSLDTQTLNGKAVSGIARAARNAGVPVVAVCGQRQLASLDLARIGVRGAYALTDREAHIDRCISAAAALLTSAAEELAREWIKK
ncbi:glycerate kinase [Arthrobacter pascens]|uniref:glycerate kinase n=1 Tax=Arthrobacter pascens TaxID=1677 RepID=UPI00196B7522|nr:glycerate kinase [Arthrobacter pascens]MBN3499832.1 glycerate kinase [Arthrobacter pascens]